MPTYASRIQESIRSSRSHHHAIRTISRTFEQIPPGQVADVLVEASRGLSPEVLGYLVFPALREKLQVDDTFFTNFVKLATRNRLT